MRRKRKKVVQPLLQQLILPFSFVWLELTFHIGIFRSLGKEAIFPTLFALGVGFLLSFAGGFLKDRGIRIFTWTVLSVVTLLFAVQTVYYTIFKTFLTIGMFLGNAGDATQFWREGLSGVWKAIPMVLLLLAPLGALGFLQWKGYRAKRVRLSFQWATLTMAFLTYSLAMVLISTESGRKLGLPELYGEGWQIDRGVKQFGVLVGFAEDVKANLTYEEDVPENVDYVGLPSVAVQKPSGMPSPEVTREPEATPTPTPTPVDTSPNELPIDFAGLAQKESNENIKKIHEYMSQALPTNKNEYTGMFEGYNLIMLTCEAFSPWAVDEELTPTLYKLVHEGFYFKNFYTPIWITSTSDGEYAACTGLLPDLKKNNSFKRSADISMPLGFGNQFRRLGYTARAYHNNSYTYYGRNKSHPNLGYDFVGVGNGLEITKRWPASDLEMMQVTVPEYIHDEKFHAYYMTVSGHLEYSFTGNSMSKKNQELVKDLPYSEACKAYIACNIELDRAMEYLISELEKAGILDRTVIVMSADHYPYGLTVEQIEEIQGGDVEETFELYRNHLVIWSGSMKEPVVVEKYGCSVDIAPTLCNLFGIEYDSRLYMGSDILSDAASLIIFKDGSFITDYCKYNAGNGKITMLADVALPDDYISVVKGIVSSRLSISRAILNHDYYSYVEKYLP